MNYVAKEVLKNFDYLAKRVKEYSPIYPSDKEVIKTGIDVSNRVCKQEEFVHPTPIMKNAMIVYKDVEQRQEENGEWKTTKFPADGKLGNAATKLLEILEKAMERDLHPRINEYPDGVSFTDESFYAVDCWNFFDELHEKFWDIQPGQEEQLKERFQIYSKPKTNLSLDEVRQMLSKDVLLQKTLEIEQKIWPFVKASRDITAISDPFMSKKSGVSYPDFKNDSTTVPGTDMTYGKYEIELAKDAYAKGDDSLIKFAYDNNVYTGYTRRQLGKGRALIAGSRRENLVFNMVNGPEMEKVKQTKAIQIPFLDEDGILRELTKICELAEQNGFWPVNIDASSWDQNLGIGLLVLQDAERMLLGQGNFTKKIIEARTVCNSKAYFINGPEKRIHMIYGRQFSGYDDTTLGNTKANRTSATYSALTTDKKYAEVIDKMQNYHIVTVGDDLLVVLRDKKLIPEFIKTETDKWRFVIHGAEKFAQGVFFIQWRVFKDQNGKYTMAYNIPRVFRSMLSKEDAKHLGRGGWTLAYYQQLGKLARYPKALKIALNILAAFDQYHLSLDVPVSQLLKMVQEEDKMAGSTNRRIESTAERMYHSNPNINGLKVDSDGKVKLDGNYFVKLQRQLKKVYDPNYLPGLGFANPDLSIIH